MLRGRGVPSAKENMVESRSSRMYYTGNLSQRVAVWDKFIESGNVMMETAKSQENAIRKLLPKERFYIQALCKKGPTSLG